MKLKQLLKSENDIDSACTARRKKTTARSIAGVACATLLATGGSFCLESITPQQAHADSAYVTTDAYQTHKVWYGGYYTTYFWIDGHVAYCGQPRYSTPWSGVYKKNYIRNDAIAAVLYYGYGGPGWNYARSNGWWPSRNRNGDIMSNDDYYAATHVLLSYLTGGWGEALYGTNQSYKNWASNNLFGWVLTNLRNNIYQIPDAFKNSVYWMDPGWNTRSGRQGQDFYSYNWVDAGGIRLNKTDASTGKPIRNISFDIYNSDQWGNMYGRAARITTDSAGNAATRQNQLPVGWYVIQEVNPPANCKAVKSYPIQVQSNYSYAVRKAVNGKYSGGTFGWSMFTNRATTQIEFTKQYDGTVAESTQIELYRNGVPTGQKRTINKQGNYNVYNWGFYDLDKYDANGRNYTYSVKEVGVSNNRVVLNGKTYQVVQSGNFIRNIELKDVSVRKVWDDKDNKYDLRPDGVKVKLIRYSASGATEIDSQVLSAENNWSFTWKDMPVASANGDYYSYSVKEEEGTTTSKIFSSFYNADTGILTNSLNTRDIPVQKEWMTTKALPASITLQLMNGNTVVDEAVVQPVDGQWGYKFTGVPIYDKQGNEINYTVRDSVDGYTNIVNKYIDESTGEDTYKLINVSTETLDIPVSKTWIENIAPTSPRPTSIIAVLYSNGQPTGKTLTISSSNGWKGAFTDLPRYNVNTGKEIVYTVGEQPVDGYAWEATGSSNEGFVITNSFGATSVNVQKVWTNENGNTSRRPSSIVVKLLGDGSDTGKTLTLNSAGSWKGTFSNLPKYNEQGNEIVYTVSENPVGFYASSVSGNQKDGYTITNKYAENETSIPVAKSWDDKDNEAGLRPANITAVLKQQKHNGAQKLATQNASVNVPRKINVSDSEIYARVAYANGKAADYTAAANYSMPFALYGSLNTNQYYEDWTINQTGTKYNNASQLLNSYGVMKIDLSSSNNIFTFFPTFDRPANGMNFPFCFTFQNIKYADYNATSMQWKRWNGLAYYTSAVSTSYYPDVLIIDSNNNGYLGYDYTYSKEVYDWGNIYSMPPKNTGLAYSTQKFKRVITSDAQWSSGGTADMSFLTQGTVSKTSTGKNAHQITLLVPTAGQYFYPTATANARHALSFYYTAASDTTVNIKMQTQTGYWNEGNTFATFTAKAGTHYYTITQNATNSLSGKVRLDFIAANGTNLNGNVVDLSMWNTAAGITTTDTGKTLTLNAGNNWSGSFTGLPRFDTTTNAPIEYIVEEQPVEGYTASVKQTGNNSNYSQNEQKQNPYSSYNITNKLGDLRDIPVSKTWSDSDNLLGKRPDSIKVSLYRNGTATGDTLELSEDNNWNATFYNLRAKDDAGQLYNYTVSEERVPYYAEPVISGTQDVGFNIENTLPITEVNVEKTWLDRDNVYDSRPGTITVHLYADGIDTGKETTVSESSNWTGKFSNLPVYTESGHEIAYTVQEDSVESYTGEIHGNAADGFVLTNTLEKTQISVSKKWDIVNGQPPIDSLEIELSQNGSPIATKTLNESNNWACTFDELDVYSPYGELYEYTVDEKDFEGMENYQKEISGNDISGFTITNIENISIPVYKTWEDYNDVDELRPYSVVVRLLANGEDTGKFLELTEASEWKGEFDNLPRYDDDKKEISYSVSEDHVPYYTTEIQGNIEYGFTVTNSHSIQFTSRSVSKIWDDAADADKIRPESVTVRLLQNNAEYRTCELSDANGWTWTFEKLPIADENGSTYTYTMVEDAVDGYEPNYSQDLQLNYTITNQHEPSTRSVSVEKQWSLDEKNIDLIPSSISVQLLRNGEAIEEVEMSADDNGRWYHEFTGLPILDDNGEEYQYTVKEVPMKNFGSIVGGDQENGFVIMNYYLLTESELSGQKFWIGDNPADRPDHITVQLLRNGKVVATEEVRPNNMGQWYFSFGEQPFYDADTGEEYTYEISELPVEGYVPEYGYTNEGLLKIVNRATKSIPVQKNWNDNNNANKSRPTSIKVDLIAKRFTNSNALVYNDGKSVDGDGNETVDSLKQGYPFSLDPSNDLVGEIKLDGSVKTVVITAKSEDKSETYFTKTLDINGATEPVAFEIGTISDRNAIFEVKDEAGTDIHSHVVSLLLHDSQYATHVADTMELSAYNDWKGTFKNVLERDNKGFLLSYEVQEAACYGYTGEITGNEVSGYTITNTEVTSISISKFWAHNSSRDVPSYPESIDVKLLQNGKDTGRTTTLYASDGWTGTFDNLAWRDSQGKEYEYTVEEVPVEGWIAQVNNKIRTNYTASITNIPTIDIPVEKKWVGDEEHIDSRPAEITAELTRHVEETAIVEGETFEWESAISSFINSFANLYSMPSTMQYDFENKSSEDAFVKIALRQDNAEKAVKVIAIPANASTTGEFDLSSLESNASVSVAVSGTNAADRTIEQLAEQGIIFGSIEAVSDSTVDSASLTAEGDWVHQFTALPLVDAHGNDIIYDVVETSKIDGYVSSVEQTDGAYTITNTFGKIDIPVSKTWVDMDDKDGIRPEEITVELLANGESTDKMLTLSAANKWAGVFELLEPVDSEGNAIEYTVVENDIPDGYTSIVKGDQTDGFEVVNTHDVKTEITVTKIWDDTDNVKKIRPESLLIHLYADGEELATARLSGETDTWSYTFTELPYANEDGTIIEYTISEEDVEGYTQQSLQQTDDGYVIVNWTPAPLFELPLSGHHGIWIGVLLGLALCIIVLLPYIKENISYAKQKRLTAKK